MTKSKAFEADPTTDIESLWWEMAGLISSLSWLRGDGFWLIQIRPDPRRRMAQTDVLSSTRVLAWEKSKEPGTDGEA